MKMWIRYFALLALSSLTALAQVVKIDDDLGHVVVLAAPAKRVVTLTPHATELVAVLAPQSLIGVDVASDYPPRVAALPKVGRFDSINVEAIIALKPDLVIAWEGLAIRQALRPLQQLGIPIFYSIPQTPAQVAHNLLQLGHLLGVTERAQARASALQRDYHQLKLRYRSAQSVRVFLQISRQPLLTVSDNTFLGQAIDDCGGINSYAAAKEPVPQASIESVLAFAPQVIISTSQANELDSWRRYLALPAVAKGQLYSIDDDKLMRPGPRLVEGVRLLCERIDEARRSFAKNAR